MKRRDFIRNLSCGSMGSTTLLNSISSLGAINGLLASESSFTDYKALVCVLFAGGIDSHNLLIPAGTTLSDTGFNDYLALRTDLRVSSTAKNLLSLNNPQCSGFRGFPCHYQTFGLHPGIPGIQNLFNAGKLAIMSNIGTLVEPIANRTEYFANSKKLPLGLYSHSDQIMQWQTSVPQSRSALGFGGRMADLLHAQNSNPEISMNISLAGKNVFQRGATLTEYAMSRDISPNNIGLQMPPSWWSNAGFVQDIRKAAIDSMVAENYANLLQKTYTNTAKKSADAFEFFKEALKRVRTLNTVFPTNNNLAADLKAISSVISAREFLGVKRQIFFVTIGGWDMHNDLVGGLAGRMPGVSAAMKAFYDSLVELQIQNQVTLFTISDFGRTLTSNGDGSDHAWAGNSMVLGGAVNGGRIFGSHPKLDATNANPLNVSSRGNFIPTMSTDELYAEMALWYGVSPADLCYVLPNLGNFYTYNASSYPVGFMNFANTTINPTDHPLSCLSY